MTARAKVTATRIIYCERCKATAARPFFRCKACGAKRTARIERRTVTLKPQNGATAITDIALKYAPRIAPGNPALAHVFDGGMPRGTLTLLAGEPGLGKSTLALQHAAAVASPEHPVLYATGEETAAAIKIRAERLACVVPGLSIVATESLPEVFQAAKTVKPVLLVVDSIQCIGLGAAHGRVGGVRSINASCEALRSHAHRSGETVLALGHVVKDGSIGGPRTLEHMVDVVLTLRAAKKGSRDKVALAGLKNRYAARKTIGLTMTPRGVMTDGQIRDQEAGREQEPGRPAQDAGGAEEQRTRGRGLRLVTGGD